MGGMVRLLATALNLCPVSQLDGGHISYAVFGRASSAITLVITACMIGLTIYSGRTAVDGSSWRCSTSWAAPSGAADESAAARRRVFGLRLRGCDVVLSFTRSADSRLSLTYCQGIDVHGDATRTCGIRSVLFRAHEHVSATRAFSRNCTRCSPRNRTSGAGTVQAR
jgi:hypothetical protein